MRSVGILTTELHFKKTKLKDMQNDSLKHENHTDANNVLADAAILKLEQEVRGWSLIVNNLKKQDAPLHVWKCAAGEVSKRVRKINKLKGGLR